LSLQASLNKLVDRIKIDVISAIWPVLPEALRNDLLDANDNNEAKAKQALLFRAMSRLADKAVEIIRDVYNAHGREIKRQLKDANKLRSLVWSALTTEQKNVFYGLSYTDEEIKARLSGDMIDFCARSSSAINYGSMHKVSSSPMSKKGSSPLSIEAILAGNSRALALLKAWQAEVKRVVAVGKTTLRPIQPADMARQGLLRAGPVSTATAPAKISSVAASSAIKLDAAKDIGFATKRISKKFNRAISRKGKEGEKIVRYDPSTETKIDLGRGNKLTLCYVPGRQPKKLINLDGSLRIDASHPDTDCPLCNFSARRAWQIVDEMAGPTGNKYSLSTVTGEYARKQIMAISKDKVSIAAITEVDRLVDMLLFTAARGRRYETWVNVNNFNASQGQHLHYFSAANRNSIWPTIAGNRKRLVSKREESGNKDVLVGEVRGWPARIRLYQGKDIRAVAEAAARDLQDLYKHNIPALINVRVAKNGEVSVLVAPRKLGVSMVKIPLLSESADKTIIFEQLSVFGSNTVRNQRYLALTERERRIIAGRYNWTLNKFSQRSWQPKASSASTLITRRHMAEIIVKLPGRSVVLLGGATGSGKSELKDRLLTAESTRVDRRLSKLDLSRDERRALVREETAASKINRLRYFSIDKYFKPRSEITMVADGMWDWDKPEALNWQWIEEDLAELLEKREVVPAGYDFGTGEAIRRWGEKFTLADDDILVVDSHQALHENMLAIFAKIGRQPVTVYLDVPEDLRLLRNIVRRRYEAYEIIRQWPTAQRSFIESIEPQTLTAGYVVANYREQEVEGVVVTAMPLLEVALAKARQKSDAVSEDIALRLMKSLGISSSPSSLDNEIKLRQEFAAGRISNEYFVNRIIELLGRDRLSVSRDIARPNGKYRMGKIILKDSDESDSPYSNFFLRRRWEDLGLLNKLDIDAALRGKFSAAIEGFLSRREVRGWSLYEAMEVDFAVILLAARGDYYRELKAKARAEAEAIFPELWALVQQSQDPLEAALRIAAIGNSLDFSDPKVSLLRAQGKLALTDIIKEELAKPSFWHRNDIALAAPKLNAPGRTVLYVVDNAGEDVLDMLVVNVLLRQGHRVVLAGKPFSAANDSTMGDLEEIAAGKVVGTTLKSYRSRLAIINTGSRILGTDLARVTPELAAAWKKAALIIWKGQGNEFTVRDANPTKDSLFVQKIKWPLAAGNRYPQGAYTAELVSGRASSLIINLAGVGEKIGFAAEPIIEGYREAIKVVNPRTGRPIRPYEPATEIKITLPSGHTMNQVFVPDRRFRKNYPGQNKAKTTERPHPALARDCPICKYLIGEDWQIFGEVTGPTGNRYFLSTVTGEYAVEHVMITSQDEVNLAAIAGQDRMSDVLSFTAARGIDYETWVNAPTCGASQSQHFHFHSGRPRNTIWQSIAEGKVTLPEPRSYGRGVVYGELKNWPARVRKYEGRLAGKIAEAVCADVKDMYDRKNVAPILSICVSRKKIATVLLAPRKIYRKNKGLLLLDEPALLFVLNGAFGVNQVDNAGRPAPVLTARQRRIAGQRYEKILRDWSDWDWPGKAGSPVGLSDKQASSASINEVKRLSAAGQAANHPAATARRGLLRAGPVYSTTAPAKISSLVISSAIKMEYPNNPDVMAAKNAIKAKIIELETSGMDIANIAKNLKDFSASLKRVEFGGYWRGRDEFGGRKGTHHYRYYVGKGEFISIAYKADGTIEIRERKAINFTGEYPYEIYTPDEGWTMAVLARIREVINNINESVGRDVVDYAWVFGSMADGDWTKDQDDVDIFVHFTDPAYINNDIEQLLVRFGQFSMFAGEAGYIGSFDFVGYYSDINNPHFVYDKNTIYKADKKEDDSFKQNLHGIERMFKVSASSISGLERDRQPKVSSAVDRPLASRPSASLRMSSLRSSSPLVGLEKYFADLWDKETKLPLIVDRRTHSREEYILIHFGADKNMVRSVRAELERILPRAIVSQIGWSRLGTRHVNISGFKPEQIGGNNPFRQVEEIADEILPGNLSPFEFEARGIGMMPRLAVIFIPMLTGSEVTAEVERLISLFRLTTGCPNAGIIPFPPHVTVGYVEGNVDMSILLDKLNSIRQKPWGRFHIDRVKLSRVKLYKNRERDTLETIKEYSLRGSSPLEHLKQILIKKVLAPAREKGDLVSEGLALKWIRILSQYDTRPLESGVEENLEKLDTLGRLVASLGLLDNTRTVWREYAGMDEAENCADHSWGNAFLTLVFSDAEITERVLAMAVVHDLAEAVSRDYTPGDNIPQIVKHSHEESILRALWSIFPNHDYLFGLIQEYNQGQTPAACKVKSADKLDLVLQTFFYWGRFVEEDGFVEEGGIEGVLYDNNIPENARIKLAGLPFRDELFTELTYGNDSREREIFRKLLNIYRMKDATVYRPGSHGRYRISPASRAWSTAWLSLAFAPEALRYRTLAMAIIKDLPYVEPQAITASEKRKALASLLSLAPEQKRDELLGIWDEYEAGNTPASRFTKLAEGFAEALLDAKQNKDRESIQRVFEVFLASVEKIAGELKGSGSQSSSAIEDNSRLLLAMMKTSWQEAMRRLRDSRIEANRLFRQLNPILPPQTSFALSVRGVVVP